MNPKNKYLIVITGPTASGKTTIAIQIAQHFTTEIVSADARQFYREMEIGTAKPSADELKRVPHHFINNLSVYDNYDVGQYELQAIACMEEIFSRKDIVVLCGGSGLFIHAITNGLDTFPDIDPKIKKEIQQQFQLHGIEPLREELKKTDPVYFDKADMQNPMRIMRALEVIRTTGLPFSSFRSARKKDRSFGIIKIAIDMDRGILYDRIDHRVDDMINAGLVEEARKLFPLQHLNALQTVGYQELFDHFKGVNSLNESIRLIKQHSRNYAKRQLTWLRREKDLQLMPPDAEKIISFIENKIAEEE